MYTSDTEKKYGKTALVYLLISIFCALFGGVYECFGHGVYSYYMLYAFAFPLVGGALPALLFSLSGAGRWPSTAARTLYRCGIATFTVGSIVRGILEIYGTTNALTDWYFPIAAVLAAAGAAVYLVQYLVSRS